MYKVKGEPSRAGNQRLLSVDTKCRCSICLTIKRALQKWGPLNVKILNYYDSIFVSVHFNSSDVVKYGIPRSASFDVNDLKFVTDMVSENERRYILV